MRLQQAIIARQRSLFIISTILIIVGSFLPWEVWGDFLPVWRYGIQILPVFVDNGGFIPLLISVITLGLIFRTPNFVKRPTIWIVLCAIALVIISGYHIIDWLLRRIASSGIIGAPEIKIGLILVALGSLLTLLITLVVGEVKQNDLPPQI
jgi:hypothetical protein